MIDVTVDIFGITIYCDESILEVEIGNGYSFEKVYLDALPHSDKLIDDHGIPNIEYKKSCLVDENGEYFICLKKHDIFQIHGLDITPNTCCQINDPTCSEQLAPYHDREIAYLYQAFSLLRLFQSGNIGYCDLFFDYNHKIFGIINHKTQFTSHSYGKNIFDDRKYFLSTPAVIECTQFFSNYMGAPFNLLKPSIDMFIWGLEQLDAATGLEKYTTALEMTLLEKSSQNKKKMLANRVAILTGTTASDIIQIYTNMLNYYSYRSESLHEGIRTNISIDELHNLEQYVRDVLKKCLQRCKNSSAINLTVTWNEVKRELVDDLKSGVTAAKTSGILPS